MSNFYNKKAIESDEDSRQGWLNKKKKYDEIAINLCKTKFKKDVMEEALCEFWDPDFSEKLDNNKNLIGFENGVFDLIKYEFRDGRPEDCISLSTKTDYIEYEEDCNEIKEIYQIIEQIQPKLDMRNYVLSLLSSCLSGENKEQKFHIWEGVGSNGKSILVELFEQAFGKYCGKIPISLLTSKRSASNAANPELARLKGKRFCVLQEPEEDVQMNVGLMKELSGGDTILARALFSEPVEYKPQFKMVLTCNHLPKIPSNDGGTWRRIRVVEFKSQFVDNPDNNDTNQYKADGTLPGRLETYKEAFMSILIRYYKNYKKNGLVEPPEVKAYTKKYKEKSDFYSEFINEFIEETNNNTDTIKLNDIYADFKNWFKECNGSQSKCPSRLSFKEQFEKKYGPYNNIFGWRNLKRKYNEDELNEDEDGVINF